ncbi:ANTAR domain-containing protein [Pseudovibrio sp. Ad26]|uniref:ANTAR domain-containing response regulator n=1 Tax=Pseudovibrio sp. Ad26 TaxID=989410 RepID=UPI0007AEC9AA|nr:ANTAR domain-containing protein [Pseudovibrio sp. Ad26]KZL09048.1 Aliphatic amidase regulator [Pseudovibrio sp. Ad26]
MFKTPNFRGWAALVAHRPSDNISRLIQQLERLGMYVDLVWPTIDPASMHADVVFFDGDNSFDELFPWSPGNAPVPLIALLATEAPGRLEWVLQQGVSAHLLKPIGSGGVFSTLVIASANFARQQTLNTEISELKKRVQLRPVVLRAVFAVMSELQLNDDQAFSLIRQEAMRRRQSVEAFCQALTVNGSPRLSGVLCQGVPQRKVP